MDPINPWIDSTEVRQLAEKLLRPVEHSRIVSTNPGFDTSFVGFVDSDETEKEIAPVVAPKPVEVVAKTPTPAPISPAPTSITPAPSTPTSSVPAPSNPAAFSKINKVVKVAPTPKVTTLLDSRFQILRNWLLENFSAKEIFILDHTGSVIYDESHHGRLHFIARDLILQAKQTHNVRVKFGPDANLELIPCETPNGIAILGALFPNSLPNEHITIIREVLIQAITA
jgi:hypothetical protein